MKRIKKGDTVIVIAGKNKGHVGEVKSRIGERVFVEGANMIVKHMKPTSRNEKGSIVNREASLHISNIALYNPLTKSADKVGFKYVENAGVSQKVRYFKSNNEVIDRI